MSNSRYVEYKSDDDVYNAYKELNVRQSKVVYAENIKAELVVIEKELAEHQRKIDVYTKGQKIKWMQDGVDQVYFYLYLNYIREQSRRSLIAINACTHEQLLDYDKLDSVKEVNRFKDSIRAVRGWYLADESYNGQAKIFERVVDRWNSTDPVLTPKKRWLGVLSAASVGLSILAAVGVLALLAFPPTALASAAIISTGWFFVGAVLGGSAAIGAFTCGLEEGYYTGKGFMPALVGAGMGLVMAFCALIVICCRGDGSSCSIGPSGNGKPKYRSFKNAKLHHDAETREMPANNGYTPDSTRKPEGYLGAPASVNATTEVSQAPAATVQPESRRQVEQVAVVNPAPSLTPSLGY